MTFAYMQYPDGMTFTTDNPSAFSGAKQLTPKAGKQARKDYSERKLREYLPIGSTVFTVQRSRSRNSYKHNLALFAVIDGELQWLTTYVADFMGYRCPFTDPHQKGLAAWDGADGVVQSLSCRLYDKPTALRHQGV